MLLSVSLLDNCMVELEESCSKKQKISLGNEAAHNSSQTSVLTKLLITLCKLAHKAAHNSSWTCSQSCAYSIQKDRLHPFMPIHNTGSWTVREPSRTAHKPSRTAHKPSRTVYERSGTWWKLFLRSTVYTAIEGSRHLHRTKNMNFRIVLCSAKQFTY